jgi:hypothetical protein
VTWPARLKWLALSMWLALLSALAWSPQPDHLSHIADIADIADAGMTKATGSGAPVAFVAA